MIPPDPLSIYHGIEPFSSSLAPFTAEVQFRRCHEHITQTTFQGRALSDLGEEISASPGLSLKTNTILFKIRGQAENLVISRHEYATNGKRVYDVFGIRL